MQITLNKWLKIKSYEFFYLENTFNVVFIDKVPNDYKIIKKTKNKIFGPLNIISRSIVEPYQFKQNNYHVPFLKSHLQKCIRRQHIDQSITTAYYLMSRDMNQFLRRILIIIIEDTCLIKQYIWLTWLMCAYPVYKINAEQVYYILGIIKYLCQHIK